MAYLMVFAVDSAGAIHWYYPEGGTATSVPIRSHVREEPLPHRVTHPLAPGPLTLFAWLTTRAHSVAQVEALIRAGQLEQPSTDGVLQRMQLRVVP
jgi:hypothetical protein